MANLPIAPATAPPTKYLIIFINSNITIIKTLLTYLRGLEVAELKEEDMPMIL